MQTPFDKRHDHNCLGVSLTWIQNLVSEWGQVAEWSEWTLRSSTLSEKSVVQILVRVQTEFIYKYNVLRFEMSMNIQCCCYPSTGNQSNANIGQAGSQLEVRRQGEYQSFVT